MSTVGVAAIKETLQVINAANALLTLKGIKAEVQTASGSESGENNGDDVVGLDLFIKALVLLQKPQSTYDMPNSPDAPSNEHYSADNNENAGASPNRKSPVTLHNERPAAAKDANDSELPTPRSNAKQNSPTSQHTSDEDINDSDSRTPETSGSLSSSIAPFASDDDINNSGLPTPETSASQTSSIAPHTSDDDVNDPELQARELNTSQTPPNPIYLAENLTVACPHCKEHFSLKNAEISPDKNLIVPKKEIPQDNQEIVAETSEPPKPSIENTEAPAVEPQIVKRKRNSSFGNNYSKSPKKANKRDFTVNYVHVKHNNPLKIKNKTSLNSDMVPIGDGNASVPTRLLKYMDWSSYTNATRKLLTAVFSRSVLATHSLTGKPSPAFPNKPAKKQLNPALVNDIVQTVVDYCRVPESVVRTSITTKCADESKMLRSRTKAPKQKSESMDQENISPSKIKSDDSDDS